MALVASFGQKKKKKRPNAKLLFSDESKSGKTAPKARDPKSQKPGTGSSKSTTDQEDPHAMSPGSAQKGPKLPFLFDGEHNLVRLRRQRLADLEGADFISKWKNSDAYIGSNMLAKVNRWQDFSAADVARSFGRDKVLASDIRIANQKRSDLRSLDYQIRMQAAHDKAEAFYELWKENNRKARAAKAAASTEAAAREAVASAQSKREQTGVSALDKPIASDDESRKRLESADYKGGRSAPKQDRAQGQSTNFDFGAGMKPPMKTARAAAQSKKYLDSNGQVTKERQAEIDKEIAKGGTKIFVNGHELTRRVSGYINGKPIYTSGVDPSKAKTAQEWQQRWAGLKQKAEDAGGVLQGSLSSPVQITDRYTGERLAPAEVNRRAAWGKMARETRQMSQQIQDLERKRNVLAPSGTEKPGAQITRNLTAPFGTENPEASITRNLTAPFSKEKPGAQILKPAVGTAKDIIDRAAESGDIPRPIPIVGAPTSNNLDATYRGFRSIGRAIGRTMDRGFFLDGGWKQYMQPRLEGMEKFGDRVGRSIGEALQSWADSNRKLPKQMKRDYTRKRNFTRIVR